MITTGSVRLVVCRTEQTETQKFQVDLKTEILGPKMVLLLFLSRGQLKKLVKFLLSGNLQRIVDRHRKNIESVGHRPKKGYCLPISARNS